MYKCDNSAGAPGGDGQVDGGEDHHAGHVHGDHQLVGGVVHVGDVCGCLDLKWNCFQVT